MTSILGMKFKDFIVLACDRQATSGHIKNEVSKYHRITDNIYCVGAGAVVELEYLITVLKDITKTYELKFQKPISVRSLASALSKYCYSKTYNNPFIGFELFSEIIIGGYVYTPDIQVVSSIGEYFQPITDYYASGSGRELIYAHLDSNFDKKLSKEGAIDLAYNAIVGAIKRDIYSNLSIDIVVIDKKKTEIINKPINNNRKG